MPWNLITVACPICSREFTVHAWYVEKGTRKFCSAACYQESRKKPIASTCAHCGTPMRITPYNVRTGTGKYCSEPCRDRHNARPLADRFWEKVDKDGPIPAHCPELGKCWVWTNSTIRGYGTIGVTIKGTARQKIERAHRVSWILHFGPIPNPSNGGVRKGETLWVLHKCDNRACVRPSHLFLGTSRDNVQDMLRKGRGRWGDRWATN